MKTFVTFEKNVFKNQITLDDIYEMRYTAEDFENQANTIRRYTVLSNLNFSAPKNTKNIQKYAAATETLAELSRQVPVAYYSFKIPKHSGGLRQIDAPEAELKDYQDKVKDYFQKTLRMLENDCAYAYVKNRTCKKAIERHQANKSKWFLKMDIKSFFPSCTKETVYNLLKQQWPVAGIVQTHEAAFKEMLDKCFLNGVLPQGSPASPIISNLIMTPLDFEIKNMLIKDYKHMIYTRYADDILISCPYNFEWKEIEVKIKNILQGLFEIKEEKTRYGSANGRNWNLGLMLNKDNQITIGHKKKERFRATLFQFMTDLTNGNIWSIVDTQVLQGNYSYFRAIEPENIEKIVNKYETKFNLNFKNSCKEIINQSV